MFRQTTALIVLVPAALFADTRPASEPVPELPPELAAANAVAEGFIKSIRAAQWNEALRYCSAELQEYAKQYPSAEAFFRAVVPLRDLQAQEKIPSHRWHPGPKGKGWGQIRQHLKVGEVPLVKLVEDAIARGIFWSWSISGTGRKAVVTFPAQPFAEYLEQEVAIRRRAQEKLVAQEKALEPKLRGVSTRLTALRKQVPVGAPIPLRLELINEGSEVLTYNDSHVDLFCSMSVKDQHGQEAVCISGPVQTVMGHGVLRPGQTVTLLDGWDLRKQYRLGEPGRYRVQIPGKGLFISEADPDRKLLFAGPEGTEARPAPLRTSFRRFPSNIVEIEVAATRPE